MWYLVLSRRQASLSEVRAHTPHHFTWIEQQHLAGNVLFSGPTPDRAMGIYVVRARSLEAARQVVETDPLHALGLRQYEIIEWEVHQVLGVGPFSLESIAHLAEERQDGSYTPFETE